MKKQTKTYVLLAVVIAVWGLLGLKVVQALSTETEVAPQPMALSEGADLQPVTTKDTFSIAADYRDPFLGTLPKIERPKKKTTAKADRPASPKKNITYQGSVSGDTANSRVYFVAIDGQQHVMSRHEKINGVTLIWGSAQKIKVSYPGHQETIALNE